MFCNQTIVLATSSEQKALCIFSMHETNVTYDKVVYPMGQRMEPCSHSILSWPRMNRALTAIYSYILSNDSTASFHLAQEVR